MSYTDALGGLHVALEVTSPYGTSVAREDGSLALVDSYGTTLHAHRDPVTRRAVLDLSGGPDFAPSTFQARLLAEFLTTEEARS